MEDEALYNQWQNFTSSDQWDRARQVLGEMLAREPDSSWVHYQLGFACYQLSDHQPSVYHYREAIRLDPDDDDHYRGLAHTFLAMGRAGTADDNARMALRLNPDNFANWILMAHLCLHFEDKKEAKACIDRAASFAPESTSVLSLKAKLGELERPHATEDAEQSLNDYRVILEKDPEHENALYQSGLIHLTRTRNYQKAKECFRRALAQDPTDKDYQTALIESHRQCDHILRLLWAPVTLGRQFVHRSSFWVVTVLAFLLTGSFGVAAAFGLFLSYLVAFWPPVKLYELFTLSETHRQLGTLAIYRGPMKRFHRLNRPIRFALFFLVIFSYWFALAILWYSRESASFILAWTSALLMGTYLILFCIGVILNTRNPSILSPPKL